MANRITPAALDALTAQSRQYAYGYEEPQHARYPCFELWGFVHEYLEQIGKEMADG